MSKMALGTWPLDLDRGEPGRVKSALIEIRDHDQPTDEILGMRSRIIFD